MNLTAALLSKSGMGVHQINFTLSSRMMLYICGPMVSTICREPEKMAQEKLAQEKMALGKNGIGKNGTKCRLGKNGTYN